MQYLPVVFAVFQVFFLLGLVIYYMAQAMLAHRSSRRTSRGRFYGHDEALGRQAQRAGEQARELAKEDGDSGGGGGFFGQANRDLAGRQGRARPDKAAAGGDGDAPRRAGRPSAPPNPRIDRHRPARDPPADPRRRRLRDRPGGARTKSSGKRRK